MKKITLIALLAAALAAPAFAGAAVPPAKQITALKKQVATLKAQNAVLKSQVAADQESATATILGMPHADLFGIFLPALARSIHDSPNPDKAYNAPTWTSTTFAFDGTSLHDVSFSFDYTWWTS